MRYNLFFALLLVSFYAQAQYNSSQSLLKDTNIVWAARGYTIINANNNNSFAEKENPDFYFNLLKYQSAETRSNAEIIKDDFAFLLPKSSWEAHPNRYFVDSAFQQPAKFEYQGALYLPLHHGEDSFMTNNRSMGFIPIRQADVELYRVGFVSYYDKKNNRFGCLMEYIAPVLKDSEQKNVPNHLRKPQFYFRTNDWQLAKNANIGNAKILRALSMKWYYEHDAKYEIKTQISYQQAVESYLTSLRKANNAQRYLQVFNTENERDLFEQTDFQRYQISLGYEPVLSEEAYKEAVKNGKGLHKAAEKANLSPIPAKTFTQIEMQVFVYYNESQELTHFCPQTSLFRLKPTDKEPTIYLQHKF